MKKKILIFLVKSKMSKDKQCETVAFSRFFQQENFHNFLREIKVVNIQELQNRFVLTNFLRLTYFIRHKVRVRYDLIVFFELN